MSLQGLPSATSLMVKSIRCGDEIEGRCGDELFSGSTAPWHDEADLMSGLTVLILWPSHVRFEGWVEVSSLPVGLSSSADVLEFQAVGGASISFELGETAAARPGWIPEERTSRFI